MTRSERCRCSHLSTMHPGDGRCLSCNCRKFVPSWEVLEDDQRVEFGGPGRTPGTRR